jgi:CheY-like chemotaxis protein
MAAASDATVLLVEDNPDHAEFTLKALRGTGDGPTVIWAKDGQEAVDLLAENHPQLVLLDIHLPKLSGHEVLRRVKTDDKLRTIPIVMMSTSDRAADVADSYRAGANGYVSKPVSFKELRERVTTVKDYWLTINRVPGMPVI